MDLISQKEVYKKGSIVFIEKTFVAQGKELTRVSLSLGKNAVLIIPVDSKGNFYLGRQRRVDSQDFVIEFPNGGVEEGEKEIEAAKRELSEELGLEGEMKYIGKFRPFPTLVDLEVNVFLCSNATEQEDSKKLKSDFYEKIEKMIITERELYDLVKRGKVSDSYFLSSLSLYMAYKNK